MITDQEAMEAALAEARLAAEAGEVPIGAVIVHNGELLARGQNRVLRDVDPTAHAEMVALRAAAHALGNYRLAGCTLYVTLEPCAMCAGALVLARVARVVYGCDDPKGGAVVTLYAIGQDARLNHRFALTSGVLAAECAERLRSFFAVLRAQK
jgi:tRNA(adenine34) deaminase